jgi:MFS family permease
MAAGTIIFGLGTRPWLLFLGRVLQGFASALLYTVSLALLVDTVPREEVGKYLGLALSANNVGLVLSPLFGGIIYHSAGKFAVFGTMMGLIGVDATLRLLMVAEPRRVRIDTAEKTRQSSFDAAERNAVVGPENTLLSSPRPNKPVLHLQIPGSTTRVTGILRLIRSPRLLAALYGIFLNECLNASLMAVIPLFVAKTFHWNTLGAGLIFLTIAIPSLGGFLAGSLSDRFGPKMIAGCGLVIAGPTVICLRFVEHDTTRQVVLLCALLTVIGKSSELRDFLADLGTNTSN